jgi:hypothetical protein
MPYTEGNMRPVILHFHTYKNAGSTIDGILQRCFPQSWANFDGPVPEFFIPHSEIAIIARNRPHLQAISSHQIRLPVPVQDNLEFLPIVFIRRPELRAASMWRFERQRDDNHPATLLAKDLKFRDWVARLLKPEAGNKICNAQTYLFSFQHDSRGQPDDPANLERARANLEALPLIGVVEAFASSMRQFERLYRPKLPQFAVGNIEPVNVTAAAPRTTEEKLAEMERELGSLLFRELQARNSEDIELCEMAAARLEATEEAEATPP